MLLLMKLDEYHFYTQAKDLIESQYIRIEYMEDLSTLVVTF